MAFMPYKRRFQRKRRVYRSKFARQQRVLKTSPGMRSVKRLNSRNRGYINVNRRLEILSTSTAQEAQGTISTVGGTPACLVVGAPVPVSNGLPNVYDVPFSMTFTLSQLASYTEFTNLFDSYKINGVKVLVRSFANTDGALSFPMPWIECWNDHDNSVLPTVALSREIMGVKHKYFSSSKNVISMYVKPKPIIESTGTTTSISAITPKYSQWIDCADSDIQHYGIKGIIHNYTLPTTNAGNNRLEFDVAMNVSFKDIQ